MYIRRHLENVLNSPEYLRGVMAVTGARQTGKSTLMHNVFEHKGLNTVVLDELEMRTLAKTNPKLFLARNKTPLFIDEAQYAPELFPYMKAHVDRTKEKGVFFLSGSQRFNMIKDLNESLAGRVGIFELLGLSMREIHGDSFAMPFVPTHGYLAKRGNPSLDYTGLWLTIFKGSFPELHSAPELSWEAFYNDYINTYIERDVKKIENIGDEIKFYQFLQVTAANSGSILSIDGIAKDIGITRPTCEKWLSVLRSSNLIYLLPPYHSNVTKRAIKTPKLYFLDTGLMAYLTKWHSAEQIEVGAMSGAFLETFVFCEILKSFYNSGIDPKNYLYFYRDKDGNEIDLIINSGGLLHPIEIRKSSNVSSRDIKAFRFVDSSDVYSRGEGAVICLNDKLLPLTETDNIVPVSFI